MLDIYVRLERPGEEEEVGRIVSEAFGHDGTDRLVAALRKSTAWRELSFVVEILGELVAHVSYTRGWLDTPSKNLEVLILSPLSVLPKWQRQGIGSQLVEKSLAMLAGREEPLVFLEGNPAFYGKVGFKPGVMAEFIAPSNRIPELAFQFFALQRFEPWMTGRLVYPDVFWEMDAVGLRPKASL